MPLWQECMQQYLNGPARTIVVGQYGLHTVKLDARQRGDKFFVLKHLLIYKLGVLSVIEDPTATVLFPTHCPQYRL